MKIPSFSIRRNAQYAILFLLSGILLASCETITLIDLPEEKPQLVVNAVFNADSLVKVDLSQSQSVNTSGSRFTAVENASIEVFQNAASIGFLDYKGKGKYLSKTPLFNEPGAEYSLKVRASDFETAEATEIMPAEPVIGNLSLKASYPNGSGYQSYKGSFTLDDAPEDNYYFLRVWLVNNNNSKSLLYVSLENTLGQFEPYGMRSSGEYLFNDKSFNGKTLTLNIETTQGFYVSENEKPKILIELANIPKSYYSYQYDVNKQSNSDPVFSPDKSPVSNNIKNGLGIFAPYNSAALYYDVK